MGKFYLKIAIPVPSHTQQLEIVAELDKLNEVIALKRKQLTDLDSLAQSLFYEMFGDPVVNEKGWEVRKLGDIALFKNGLNFGKTEKGHAYKFLGIPDFQNAQFISCENLSTICLSESASTECLLQENDIVFVRSNGSKELVGRSVMMINCSEKTVYSGFCIRCRLRASDYSMYISYLLRMPTMRPLKTNSGRGCNISNLNQKTLSELPIPLPPLPLQQSFSAKVAAIEAEKQRVKASLKDLETLLASRIQYWFDN